MGYYEELPDIDINEELEDTKLFANRVIVDVRTPEEYNDGHVPGAINIEASKCGRKNKAYVESILTDKTAHVYTYCFSGARSGWTTFTISMRTASGWRVLRLLKKPAGGKTRKKQSEHSDSKQNKHPRKEQKQLFFSYRLYRYKDYI